MRGLPSGAMLNDLDAAIGKEILKLLPAQVGSPKINTGGPRYRKFQRVTPPDSTCIANTIRDLRKAELEIINNSPLMNSIGAILNSPMAGMMRDENQNHQGTRL